MWCRYDYENLLTPIAIDVNLIQSLQKRNTELTAVRNKFLQISGYQTLLDMEQWSDSSLLCRKKSHFKASVVKSIMAGNLVFM